MSASSSLGSSDSMIVSGVSSGRGWVVVMMLLLGWGVRPASVGPIALAGHLRVPHREQAGGVVPPRPHLQRVEVREAEAVRTGGDVELGLEQFRRVGVLRIPCGAEHDV